MAGWLAGWPLTLVLVLAVLQGRPLVANLLTVPPSKDAVLAELRIGYVQDDRGGNSSTVLDRSRSTVLV